MCLNFAKGAFKNWILAEKARHDPYENKKHSKARFKYVNSFNCWQTFMVTCRSLKSLPPSSLGMHFPKRISQERECYYWWLSDSWQHLWCGCLFHRCVKNCVMLQRSLQHPSTNNSAGAQEPLKPGEQATSLPFFSPSPQPTHSAMFVCLWEKTSYIEQFTRQ